MFALHSSAPRAAVTVSAPTEKFESMSDICCILDVEGFSVKEYSSIYPQKYCNKFLVRELAYTKISSTDMYEVKCYRFDLRCFDRQSFKPEDEKTITHQEKIHGLPFYPGKSEDDYNLIHHSNTNRVLLAMYNRCCNEERCVVAYKGGCFEKNILKELEIPSVNLELYGCPSFSSLLKKNLSYTEQTCGRHPGVASLHCAKAEVTAFRDWFMSRFTAW